jgi:hypothetical protein
MEGENPSPIAVDHTTFTYTKDQLQKAATVLKLNRFRMGSTLRVALDERIFDRSPECILNWAQVMDDMISFSEGNGSAFPKEVASWIEDILK